ncbi:hypothetical protein BST61_g7939 [Cercospora zeina]
MAERYNLRPRNVKRTASPAAEPPTRKRRKPTKKTSLSPVQANSGNEEDDAVQRPDDDHGDSAQISHEPRPEDEHLDSENNGNTSVAAPSNATQNIRNASQGSNDERERNSLAPQAEDRQQMTPAVPDADADLEQTPSDASDTADEAEENTPEALERQELSELLQEFRSIESMSLRERHVFFTEWATNHPARDLTEWFDYYEDVVKPAFYCDREWETFIALNGSEDGMSIGKRLLQRLRAIMLEFLDDKKLQVGSPPEDFLQTESWDDAIADSSAIWETTELRLRMLQDVLEKGIFPQSFDAYLGQASWQTALAAADDYQQKAQIEAQRQLMISEVLAGKMPCTFQMWFKASEWNNHAESFPGEATQLRELEEKMKQDALSESTLPRGPEWFFRTTAWNKFIEQAQDDDEKASRGTMWRMNRLLVMFGREDRCRTPARARCLSGWAALRGRLGDAAIRHIETGIIHVYAEFDPEELIAPPTLDDVDSVAEALELVKATVRVEKAKFDIAKWNECIQNAESAREEDSLINRFAEMQKAYIENGKTYRPSDKPDDPAAAAEDIGYGGSRPGTIYMEYAEHGTLSDLVAAHGQVKRLRTAAGTAMDYKIPHRLLWCIFEGLAAALCFSHRRHLPADDQQPPAVDPLVHRDIKPGNILLATPHDGVWPELPVVKLADWGIVVYKSNTEQLSGRTGTQGWMAPEVNAGGASEQHAGPSEGSDIWSLGLVMLALANLCGSEQFDFGMTPPTYKPGVQETLPISMVALIDRCLQPEPEDRIVVDDLWKAIQSDVATFKGPFGQPMKTRKRGEDEILLYQLDKYQPWGR